MTPFVLTQSTFAITVSGFNLVLSFATISNPYVVTTDDIFDLFAVLIHVKELMENLYK